MNNPALILALEVVPFWRLALLVFATLFVIVFITVTLMSKTETPAKRIKPMRMRVARPKGAPDEPIASSPDEAIDEDVAYAPTVEPIAPPRPFADSPISSPPMSREADHMDADDDTIEDEPIDLQPRRPKTSPFGAAVNKFVQIFAIRRAPTHLDDPDGLGDYVPPSEDDDDRDDHASAHPEPDHLRTPVLSSAPEPQRDHALEHSDPFAEPPRAMALDDDTLAAVIAAAPPTYDPTFTPSGDVVHGNGNGNGRHAATATIADYREAMHTDEHATYLRADAPGDIFRSRLRTEPEPESLFPVAAEDDIIISYDDYDANEISPLAAQSDADLSQPFVVPSTFHTDATHDDASYRAFAADTHPFQQTPEPEPDYQIVLEYESEEEHAPNHVAKTHVASEMPAHELFTPSSVLPTSDVGAANTLGDHNPFADADQPTGGAQIGDELDVEALLAKIDADERNGYLDAERERQRTEKEAAEKADESTAIRTAVLWPQEYLGEETAALDPHERIQFVRALAAMDDFDGAAATLYRACREEPDPEVLYEAYKSLTDSYNGAYLKGAHEIFLDNEDPRLRDIAARGLKELSEVPQ